VFTHFEKAILVTVNRIWPFSLGISGEEKYDYLVLVNGYKNKNSEIGKHLKTILGFSF